jgi:hypothetical protein
VSSYYKIELSPKVENVDILVSDGEAATTQRAAAIALTFPRQYVWPVDRYRRPHGNSVGALLYTQKNTNLQWIKITYVTLGQLLRATGLKVRTKSPCPSDSSYRSRILR